MRRAICFDDVLLEPKFSDIESRSQIDLKTQLTPGKNDKLSLPIVSAPMDTVTGPEMAAAMHASGGLGVLHRYNTIEEQVLLVEEAIQLAPGLNFGAAIGTTDKYESRACALYEAGCRIFCLDVAHGHHDLMKKALTRLRKIFGNDVHLMAGNIATLEAFNDLSDWGADSIRVGVGGGSICSTRVQTGHGIPTLQSVIDCSMSDRDATLIADGGIKNSGDMVKALAAGADAVHHHIAVMETRVRQITIVAIRCAGHTRVAWIEVHEAETVDIEGHVSGGGHRDVRGRIVFNCDGRFFF